MTAKMRPDGTPYNILEQNMKRLGATMLILSIYDLVVALFLLIWPQGVAGIFGCTDAACTFRPLALVHLTLPCFGLLAWMDPKRNIVIVTGAIIARIIYALALGIWIVTEQLPLNILALGGISLVFAALHYYFLRRSDFGFWEILSRAGNPPGVSGRRFK